MSEPTTDIIAVAVVTGIIALAFAFIKALFYRTVQETDAKLKALEKRLEDQEGEGREHDALLRELRGTVNSESWGLVSVVGKLSTNVEKLTSAVDRMDALVNIRSGNG